MKTNTKLTDNELLLVLLLQHIAVSSDDPLNGVIDTIEKSWKFFLENLSKEFLKELGGSTPSSGEV
jgi:hypothetical protein